MYLTQARLSAGASVSPSVKWSHWVQSSNPILTLWVSLLGFLLGIPSHPPTSIPKILMIIMIIIIIILIRATSYWSMFISPLQLSYKVDLWYSFNTRTLKLREVMYFAQSNTARKGKSWNLISDMSKPKIHPPLPLFTNLAGPGRAGVYWAQM